MKKKCVVIIARAFSPVKAIATERISKIARSFAKENWRVIVLTIDDKGIKEDFFDNSREDFIEKYDIEVIRTPYMFKEIYHIYDSKKNTASKIKKLFGVISHKIGFDDSIGWLPALLSRLRRLVREEEIDLVVSSGSPFLTFYAPYKIFKETETPYVLDFRDLWYAQPHGNKNILQKFVSKKLENIFMNNAKLVTTVSNGCKYKLAQNTKLEKINILYNVPDENYIDEVLSLKEESYTLDLGMNKNYFNLVYTGTLYDGRDLTSIAQSIQSLEKDLQKKIRLHYFGSRGLIAKQNFEKYNLGFIIIDHGNVSKKEALASLFQADLLISIIHNSTLSIDESVQGIITTKIFDYIIVNKPVINIAPEDNETRELMKKIGATNVFSYTGESIDMISKKIEETMRNYNLDSQDVRLDWHKECIEQLILETNK